MLLGCSLAGAQSVERLPGFEMERLEVNTGRGSLLVGSGELTVPSGFSVNLLGHYQRAPLILNDGDQNRLAVVRDRATSVLTASYGVLSWLELSAQLPFVMWQQGQPPTSVGLAPLSGQGLGTPLLQARMSVLSRRQRKPVDLSADLGVGLPFGSESALAGDAGPRFHARMTLGTSVGWLQASMEAGVLFRPVIPIATSALVPTESGATSEVRLGGALTTTGQGLRGELGLRAILTSQPSMEVLGGVRFPLLPGLDAFALGGPGLGQAPGIPMLRVLAGVSFRSEPAPRLSYLDERADRELQLTLAAPAEEQGEEEVRPTPNWEIRVARSAPGSAGDTGSVPRPYQPGPQERLLLRGEIRFTTGSDELPDVVPILDQATLRLAGEAQRGVIYIEGHADARDGDSSNTILSLRRAQAVRRYLIDQGIRASQVKIRGFGASWPVSAKPATEEERQLNRRAEILLLTGTETASSPEAPTP